MTPVSAAVFIESNTSGSGGDFLVRAREMGHEPVLLTDRPDRYAFLSRLPHVKVVVLDTTSEPAVSACLDELAARSPIALVLSTSDFYLPMAAIQAERLGLVGAKPAVIALCRDKARQTEALHAAGVGVPARSTTVDSLSGAGAAIASVGLPMIIKPVTGTGSIGVSLALSEPEGIAAVEGLFAVTVNARGHPVRPRALLAAYVEGEEFSVEILDGAVVGVTKKHLGPLPYFVEMGHDFPAPIPGRLRRRIEREATRAIEALDHTCGPAHVELRVASDKITIIEVNPRLAGGSIPSLIRHATGVDTIAAVIESARRGRPNLIHTKAVYGALRFIVPPTDGLFQPARGPADLAACFGLAEAVLYRTPPFPFRRVNDFRDRIGHVIAVDADPDAAVRRADAAISFLHQAGARSHE